MNRSNVEEIKARLPIEDIIGSYVKLEKAGKSFKAKCPFHNEKTASFFISPERGGYYCFGCGAKGDIFTFVEQFEGLDFRGALKILADKAGVQLTFDKNADGESDKMRVAMEEATKYFELEFDKSKDAREYLKRRGITDETRKSFRIGFAPEGWTNLSVYLKGKGYSEALIEKVGLIKQKDSNESSAPPPSALPVASLSGAERLMARGGNVPNETGSNSNMRHYDRFRGRIMFPIMDSSGRVIAFSGRILKDDGKSAKYLNSPDTPLYDKSLILYGLDKAKSEIRRLNYSILVEGQMDLVMSHQAGIKNTVASSGTALTDEISSESGVVSNLGLVRRLSPNIIIAFDSDQAGRKAAMRASGIALGMGMDVKIADIIGGKDPADLVKDDIEKWKNTLRNAKPVIEFEIDNVIREIEDHRKMTKAIQDRVLPLIARIESVSDQSHFVQMVADRTKLTADIVWQDLKIVQKRLKDAAFSNVSAANSSNAAMPNIGANKPQANVRTSSEQTKRIDIVERRLFGLLYLMEKENKEQAKKYLVQLKKIADNSFEERAQRAKTMVSDLLFEAEEFFGAVRDNWDKQAEILLSNFEEDLVNEEIIRTMQELKIVEKDQDKKLLGELVKKCQALSMRKAEIGKRRKR
jgi:DNA primase